jgi:AcrR family transcriptional regulator
MNERSFIYIMAEDNYSSKSDRTVRTILDSAYDLFASQGYAATSMRQIAERSGLAVGGIYNHFPCKEEIFRAVILERHPFYLILPLLKEVQGESMDEFTRKAARSMVVELEHHPEFLNLLLIELVEFKARHAAQLFEKLFPELMVVAQKMAVFQDDLRPIPLPMLMRAFLGMFFSYFITDMLLKNLMPSEMQASALDVFVDIFLYGISQHSAQQPAN